MATARFLRMNWLPCFLEGKLRLSARLSVPIKPRSKSEMQGPISGGGFEVISVYLNISF